MAAKKGQPRPEGAGRTKGVPNKMTTDLKQMILGALDDAGGRAYLAEQAILNPGPFMSLIGKVLPKDIIAKIDTRIEIVDNAKDWINSTVTELNNAITSEQEPLH